MLVYPHAQIIRHLAVFILALAPLHGLAGGHNSTRAEGTYQAAAILSNLPANGSGSHSSGTNVSAMQTAAPQKKGSGWVARNNSQLSRKQRARQFHQLQKNSKAQNHRNFADLPPWISAQLGSFAVPKGNVLKLETRRQRKRREASGRGDVVFVGNNQWTGITGNCEGQFQQFEDVNLSNPTHPPCSPFTGTLNSKGHRLNLTQTGNGITDTGLFDSLNYAHIDLELDHVRMKGTGDICAIANRVGFNNTALVRGGRIELKQIGNSEGNTGVFGAIQGSHNAIELENMQINIGFDNSVRNAGGVGQSYGSNNTLIQKNVVIMVNPPDQWGIVGGGLARFGGQNSRLDQMGVNVSARGVVAGGGVGVVDTNSTNNTVTQIGVRISYLGTDTDTELGAAYGWLGFNARVRLRLFSGHAGDYPICGRRLAGSAITGFIDIAGYTAGNTTVCGDALQQLNTTGPAHWRQAHSELCGSTGDHNQTSCHYPHEQLLDAVHGENDTLWLVSRQRYPYKMESNDKGLVRITGLNLSGVSAPTPNISFAEQGIRLLAANASAPPLPEGVTPTAWSASQDNLVALYPTDNNQGVMLASFPLRGEDGDYYDCVNVTEVVGTPVHLTREEANYTVWTRETNQTEDIIRRYQLEPLGAGFRVVNESDYNLTLTVIPNAQVMGIGSANDLLYLVHRSGTDILLDRIDMQTGELFYRNVLRNLAAPEQPDQGLPNVPDPDTGFNYTVYPQGNDTVLLLPRRSVLAAVSLEQVQGLRVTLPEFGGRAEWQTLDGPVLNIIEQYADNQDDGRPNAGTIGAGVVAGAGVLTTAASVGVICSCKHSKLCKRCRKQARQQWRPGKGRKSPMDDLQYLLPSQDDPVSTSPIGPGK